MPRLKTEAAKKSLLRRVRRQRLKYIAILPSLITILNGVCGFTAIIFASKGVRLGVGQFTYFAMSGYMIMLAMIADVLDGRLARRVKSTSSFGGQLDSLCDIVSFGVAPAFLMLKVVEYEFESAGFAGESFLQRFIWLAAAVYISCTAIRLARFNVENEEDESAHMSFIGLPSPAAAGVIASLVMLHQETLSTMIIICALPLLSLGVGILMVSRLRYPHILNQYLRGKKPFAHLIRALLLLAFVIWSGIHAALALIFCGFAASSFVKWLWSKVIRDKGSLVSAAQHPALMTVDQAQTAGRDDSARKAEN